MPWSSIEDLPETFNNLPAEAKRIALAVANQALADGDDETKAIQKAWGAVKKTWEQQEDGTWVRKSELETEDINNVELFAVGTWNGDTYTEADLDAMVEAYRAGVPRSRPVKVGHIKDGKPIPLSPGFAAPAVGWVENLRRVKDRLYGDLKAVPKTVAALIKTGAYRHRSAEVYWNFVDHEGRKWPRVFKALALLGDTPPAVQTLDDIAALYQYAEEPGEVHEYANETSDEGLVRKFLKLLQSEPPQDSDEDILTELDLLVDRMEALIRNRTGAPRIRAFVNEVRRGLGAMTKKAEEGKDVSDALKTAVYEVLGLQDTEAEEAAIAKLRTFGQVDTTKYLARDSEEYAQLAEKAARADEAEAEAQAAAQALYERERDAFLDEQLAAGRILPAELEAWRKRYDEQPAWTKEVLSALPNRVDFSERGAGSTTVAGEEAMVEAIHQRMKETGCNYEAAYDAVKAQFEER